ncbi:MAG TPA: tetratricopeptide repeat protein [Magnetovibrio sp.]
MSDTDNTPAPPSGDGPQPRKPGLFQRLFRLGTVGDELSIAVAPFIDAAEQDYARDIAAAFQSLPGVRVRILKETPLLTPDSLRGEVLPAACAQAMSWITKYNADVVLWGDVPPPGTTLFIHFAARPPVDAETAGTISPFQPLTLPVGFDPEQFGGLLIATALAAIHVDNPTKRQHRRALVAETLERAARDMEHIPRDFTVREQASVHAAFANALATFGHLFPGGEVYHRAAVAYAQAIKGTPRGESPTNWAYLQRNLGTVLQALGERSDDVETLKAAITAYRAALEVFSFETTPFPWATTSNRLGEVLYRLNIQSGETDGLKEALTLYQSALKILNRQSTPLLWSETMNNLGQAAQVLGRELGNREVIERAVAACEQALKVRTREAHPTLWASTQNNLGSALFLLGRMTGEEPHFHKALEAFMGAREVYDSLGLARMVEVTDKNIQHAQDRLPSGETKKGETDPTMWWLEGEEGE